MPLLSHAMLASSESQGLAEIVVATGRPDYLRCSSASFAGSSGCFKINCASKVSLESDEQESLPSDHDAEELEL